MSQNGKNKFGLTQRDMHTIQNIFNKYPEIEQVHIFGSRAKDNYKTGSDIDLALMNKGISDKTISKLQNDFEESSLPYTVDLVNFALLKHPEIVAHINRVGIIFYKKQ